MNHINQTPFSYGLGYMAKRLHQLVDRQVNELLRPYGLARSQWFTLLQINQTPGLSQKELQNILQIEAASLTTLIDSLAAKGLLERLPSNQDKRVKKLQLTPAGKALWATLPDPIAATRTLMLQNITAQEEHIAKRILERAIHNLEQE